MRPDPGSPADWMVFARSDLAIAQGPPGPKVLLESLCFHAQQAAEKSFKAVLLAYGIKYPFTHNLTHLSDLIPASLQVPAVVMKAVSLTDYAVNGRYPAENDFIGEEEWTEALGKVQAVVEWAEKVIAEREGK